RIGRNFESFEILKFRTMGVNGEKNGTLVTASNDKRITKIGKILRKTKIDELPQLLNILKGEMSFVGPRPEVKKYVELFKKDYERLLKVRPGITDPASIVYSKEEIVLAQSRNWEEDYIKKVLPEKIKLSSYYIANYNFFTDLKLIFNTLFNT
ncbi:MAG: sugar transferase, partial [Chloroflexi bacterium]|nr:sugar transferase [Chloroflexota bacterium]